MKKVFSLLLIFLLMAGFSAVAHGIPRRLNDFNLQYGTAGTALGITCLVCHMIPDPIIGNAPRNPYGIDLFNNGYTFAIVEPFDSDGDGFSNITEITARTFPGDPNSRPVPSELVPPTVTSFVLPLTFTIPDTSTALTGPVTAFTAVDNAGGSGVAGFMITESALAPSPSDPGWNPTPPTDFTFATLGLKTPFGWAKDAAGNVSAGLSATVTISLSPGRRFLDVPATHFALTQIDQLAAAGMTAGCSIDPPLYCPDLPITRGQMAVFLETSLGVLAAPACAGDVFTDVTAATAGAAMCGFIEELAARGITGGCAATNFCPNDPVTRQQMAVFIETALGAAASPACAGNIFTDVTAGTVGAAFCGFIERLAADGITSGCTAATYCPNNPVTRAQIAVFLVAAPAPLLP